MSQENEPEAGRTTKTRALSCTIALILAIVVTLPSCSNEINRPDEPSNQQNQAENLSKEPVDQDFLHGAWLVSTVGDISGYSAHVESYSSTGLCTIYDEFGITEVDCLWTLSENQLTRKYPFDDSEETLVITRTGQDSFSAIVESGTDVGKELEYAAYWRKD